MTQPSSILVDAHCHVDLYPDMDAIMQRCESGHVATVAVTTTPRAWPRNRDLAHRFSYIRPALGIHPQLVGQFPSELSIWDSYLEEAHVIGEVGLDAGPKFYKSFDEQKQVFRHVLQACAKAGGKVLNVHSVRAAKIVLDMVEEYLLGSGCSVMLHWFTGTASEAKRAADLGCYFSINAEMLRKDAQVNIVRSLPLQKLLTETDGPFTQSGGVARDPTDIGHTVDALSVSLGMEKHQLRSAIADNYQELFGH